MSSTDAPAWTEAERRRFEAGVIELLRDDGIRCLPNSNSLRVVLGASDVLVTWADAGKLRQIRHTIAPAELGRLLVNAAERLPGDEHTAG